MRITVKFTLRRLGRRCTAGTRRGFTVSGIKNVVGVDILCEEPKRPDIVIGNNGRETPEYIVRRLETLLGLDDLKIAV